MLLLTSGLEMNDISKKGITVTSANFALIYNRKNVAMPDAG
jgi:hypothetical protein